MGPWTSNGRTKVSSPQLAIPLNGSPVVDFWIGVGGTFGQWGFSSWTGLRVIVSDGTTTKAIVWLTHRRTNIPVDGKYTHSTFTEGIETYFFKPNIPNLNNLYNHQINVKNLFENQFGLSSVSYNIVKIEVVGQGELAFGQSGWIIVDDINIVYNPLIQNPGFESSTSNTTTDWWIETSLSTNNQGPPGASSSPWFYQSVKHSGSWAMTIMGPWSSSGRTKVSSPQLGIPLTNFPIVDFWMGVGGTFSRWGYYSWTGLRVIVSNGSNTKAIVWSTHNGVSIPTDDKYTHSTYTEGIETYFFKPTSGNLDTLYNYKINVSEVFDQQFGLSIINFDIVKIEFVGQGQISYGQHGWLIADDLKIDYLPSIANPSFESSTNNTTTDWWIESRLHCGSNGPPNDDNFSPWFYQSVIQSGSWAMTIMGPWSSSGRTKISSPQLAVPLTDIPIVDFWMGVGGTFSQWGYSSWTGLRVIVSDGTTTKAIVWLTHRRTNIPTDGKYTHSTFTEGIETYFFKPTSGNIDTLYNHKINVSEVFEQQFGLPIVPYNLVKIEFVGQGELGYGQHGWLIADDINIVNGTEPMDTEPPTITDFNTNPLNGSIDETSYVEIYAYITDNIGLDPDHQIASYQYQSIWENASLTFTGTNDRWETGSLGPFIKGSSINYKIYSKDLGGLWSSTAEKSFYVKDSDNIAPTMTQPFVNPSLPTEIHAFTISVDISDGSGIASASIHYSIDDSDFVSTSLDNTGNETYFKTFGPYESGTNFEYWLEATDDSLNSNVKVLDNNGDFYNLNISDSDIYEPTISDIGDNSPTEIDIAYVWATVTDETTGDSGILWVTVHWRKNNGSWVSYSLYSPNNGPNSFKFRLPEESYTYFNPLDEIEYYFRASDNSPNHNIAQDDNNGNYYSFTIGDSDLSGPTITNVDFDPDNPNEADTITISANISDSSGIYSTSVQYKVNAGSINTISMNSVGGTGYQALIGPFSEGDSLEWRIVAYDNSTNRNARSTFWQTKNIGSSDVTAPTIESVYRIPSGTIDDNETFVVRTTVSDISGLAYVSFGYQINDGEWIWSNMTFSGNYVSSDLGPFSAGDEITYKILAVDNSVNHNSITSSEYSFTIISSDTTPPDIHTVNYPIDASELTNFLIKVSVSDSNGIENVSLTYRVDSGNYETIEMVLYFDYGSSQEYRYNLGPFAPGTRIEFFVVAMDKSLNYNTRRRPESGTYVIVIEDSDNSPPIIDNPLLLLDPTEQSNYTIFVNITDSKGIFSAVLYYSTNGVDFESHPLNYQSQDLYYRNLGYYTTGDEFWFYIEATDDSLNHNVGVNDNNSNFYYVIIGDSDEEAPVITFFAHYPSNPVYNDSILINASVIDDYRGVENVTLYYQINNDGNWISISMINVSTLYHQILGPFSTGTQIKYYIESYDKSLNQNQAIEDNLGNYFTILIMDPYKPEVSHLNDLVYELGSNDNYLSWIATDVNPGIYILYQNKVSINSSSWISGISITEDIDGLPLGVYNYTIAFSDTSGNLITDQVWVTVEDTTDPLIINAPSNFTYELGSTDNHLMWTTTDIDPNIYILYRNNVLINTSSWVSNIPVIEIIDGLPLGIYNFTIKFSDYSGNHIINEVWLTVEDTTDPIITSAPSNFSYELGSTYNYLSWIATDLDPGIYALYRSNILINTSSWSSGISVVENIDGLSYGVHNFTIVFSDTSGNIAVKEVWITVLDTTPPPIITTTTETTDTTTVETTDTTTVETTDTTTTEAIDSTTTETIDTEDTTTLTTQTTSPTSGFILLISVLAIGILLVRRKKKQK
jgi:hypothetical protein